MLAKEYRLAGAQVGRDDTERDFHVLKPEPLTQLLQEAVHALAAGETHSGYAPAGDVGESHAGADSANLLRRRARRIGGGHDGAGAHARDALNRNLVLLEHAEDADVRQTAREAASQGQTDRMGW